MFEAINFSKIQQALTVHYGWLDLLVALVCIGAAFLLSEYLYKKRQAAKAAGKVPHHRTISGSVSRVMFPLLALIFLLLARVSFRLLGLPSFFVNIALPLMVALAVIRVLVYLLRNTFGNAAWLHTWERAISFTVWFALVLHLLGILPEIGGELDGIVVPVGKKGVSLLTMLKGVVVLLLTLSVTLWLSKAIEKRLLPSAGVHNSAYNGRLILARFLRAVLLVVAVLVTLPSIGIDLTMLTVLGGAIGVGVGLGLQRLAANYIAGFVVLMDRSVRIGDMITVGDRTGIVKQVTARYAVVRSLDGVDAMIPNETLLTQTVLNHSSSQPEARVVIPIQVAYGTDLRLALRLMEQAAAAETRVADGVKAPSATLASFGDSGINLNLGIWIRDPQNGQGSLKSNIQLRLWDLFVQNDISVPFPQQEVRVLNAHELHPPREVK